MPDLDPGEVAALIPQSQPQPPPETRGVNFPSFGRTTLVVGIVLVAFAGTCLLLSNPSTSGKNAVASSQQLFETNPCDMAPNIPVDMTPTPPTPTAPKTPCPTITTTPPCATIAATPPCATITTAPPCATITTTQKKTTIRTTPALTPATTSPGPTTPATASSATTTATTLGPATTSPGPTTPATTSSATTTATTPGPATTSSAAVAPLAADAPSAINKYDLWGLHDLILASYACVACKDDTNARNEVQKATIDFAKLLPQLHPDETCRGALTTAVALGDGGDAEDAKLMLNAVADASWTCLHKDLTCNSTNWFCNVNDATARRLQDFGVEAGRRLSGPPPPSPGPPGPGPPVPPGPGPPVLPEPGAPHVLVSYKSVPKALSRVSAYTNVPDGLETLNLTLAACAEKNTVWSRACSYWAIMHTFGLRADAKSKGWEFLKSLVPMLAGGALMCEG